jgi:membrane-associated phospholipid phosphatase
VKNREGEMLIVIPWAKATMIFVSSIVLFVAALILWKHQQLENSILIQCNYFVENETYLHFWQFISRYGMGMISVSLSALTFLSLQKKQLERNSLLFMLIVFAFALSSVAGDLMKEIVGRARPVSELAGVLAQTAPSDTYSFPSGHPAKSMGLALPFVIMASNCGAIIRISKYIVLLIATLVCCSRIALQKHYVSDVLAGISVALFFIVIAIWAVNSINKRRNLDELKLAKLNRNLGFVFIGLAIFLVTI